MLAGTVKLRAGFIKFELAVLSRLGGFAEQRCAFAFAHGLVAASQLQRLLQVKPSQRIAGRISSIRLESLNINTQVMPSRSE